MKKALIVIAILAAGCSDMNPEKQPYCRHWDMASALQHHGPLTLVYATKTGATLRDTLGNYIDLVEHDNLMFLNRVGTTYR